MGFFPQVGIRISRQLSLLMPISSSTKPNQKPINILKGHNLARWDYVNAIRIIYELEIIKLSKFLSH